MVQTLAEMVALLADQPTTPNRDSFFRALLTSRVSFRTTNVPTGVSGDYVVHSQDRMTLPKTALPDGTPALLVFADRDSIAALEPNGTYAEIDGHSALSIAAANGAGVVVQCVHGGKPSWSAVTKEDVPLILSGHYS